MHFVHFQIDGLYLLITLGRKAKTVISRIAGMKVFLANLLLSQLLSLFAKLNENTLGFFPLYCRSCIHEYHRDQPKQRQITKTNKVHTKRHQTQAKGDKRQTHRTKNAQEIQHSLTHHHIAQDVKNHRNANFHKIWKKHRLWWTNLHSKKKDKFNTWK